MVVYMLEPDNFIQVCIVLELEGLEFIGQRTTEKPGAEFLVRIHQIFFRLGVLLLALPIQESFMLRPTQGFGNWLEKRIRRRIKRQ